jgi:hypothetical protein
MFTSVPDMVIAAADNRRRELLADAAQHRLVRLVRLARRAQRRSARAAAAARTTDALPRSA